MRERSSRRTPVVATVHRAVAQPRVDDAAAPPDRAGALRLVRKAREPRKTPPRQVRETAVERTNRRREQREWERSAWETRHARPASPARLNLPGQMDSGAPQQPWWTTLSSRDAGVTVARAQPLRRETERELVKTKPTVFDRLSSPTHKGKRAARKLVAHSGGQTALDNPPKNLPQPQVATRPASALPVAGKDTTDVGSAIAALQSIAEATDSVSAIVDAGGIDTVTQLMVLHRGNEAIQKCGMAALRILLRTPGNKTNGTPVESQPAAPIPVGLARNLDEGDFAHVLREQKQENALGATDLPFSEPSEPSETSEPADELVDIPSLDHRMMSDNADQANSTVTVHETGKEVVKAQTQAEIDAWVQSQVVEQVAAVEAEMAEVLEHKIAALYAQQQQELLAAQQRLYETEERIHHSEASQRTALEEMTAALAESSSLLQAEMKARMAAEMKLNAERTATATALAAAPNILTIPANIPAHLASLQLSMQTMQPEPPQPPQRQQQHCQQQQPLEPTSAAVLPNTAMRSALQETRQLKEARELKHDSAGSAAEPEPEPEPEPGPESQSQPHAQLGNEDRWRALQAKTPEAVMWWRRDEYAYEVEPQQELTSWELARLGRQQQQQQTGEEEEHAYEHEHEQQQMQVLQPEENTASVVEPLYQGPTICHDVTPICGSARAKVVEPASEDQEVTSSALSSTDNLQDVFASMEHAVRERDNATTTEIDISPPDTATGWTMLVSTTAPPVTASKLLRNGNQKGRWRVSRAVSVTCVLPAMPVAAVGLTRRQRLTLNDASARIQRALDRGLVQGRVYQVLGGCVLPGRGTGPARKLLMLRDPTCCLDDLQCVGPAASLAAWRGPWSRGDKRWTQELRSAAAWPTDATAAARGVFYMALSDVADTFETCTVSSASSTTGR